MGQSRLYTINELNKKEKKDSLVLGSINRVIICEPRLLRKNISLIYKSFRDSPRILLK